LKSCIARILDQRFLARIMTLMKVTIRRRLQATALVISILLFGIGVLTRITIQETLINYNLLSQVKDLLVHELNMRKAEKDFLFRGTIQPEFYKTGNSAYLKALDSAYIEALNITASLKREPVVMKLNLQENTASLNQEFINYNKSWNKLLSEIKTRGFKDHGNIGEMRSQIHAVETIVKERNDLRSGNYMLTLRRHEKDYLLRKDTKYQQKFEKTYSEFLEYLNTRNGYGRALNEVLISDLGIYKDIFVGIIKQDSIIGYNNSGGFLAELNHAIEGIELHLMSLETQIVKASEKEVQKAKFTLFSSLIGLSIAIILALYITAKNINKPIEKLKNHVLRLGNGELPENVKIKGKNEITDMADSINVLTDNLNNTRDFAIEVGKGNFETQINVFNNQGDLGGSLIRMREQLLNVSQEREVQKKKDEKTMWASEGIARIGKIINRNDAEIEETSQTVISLLIEYLNASVGGVFIKDKDKDLLHLTASYAYTASADDNVTYHYGEGLVGVCALEGKTNHITDLPDNYMVLASGLGQAKPSDIVIVPMKSDDNTVVGVMEIASFNNIQSYQIEFLENIAGRLGTAMQRLQQQKTTKLLLKQAQTHTSELENREEELRQNMEELTSVQESMAHKEKELENQYQQINKATARVIAQLKKDLEAQRLSNKDNEEFLEVLNNILLFGELTPKGEVISANNVLLKKYDYNEAELKGRNIREFIPKEEMIDFEVNWNRITNGETVTRFERHISKSIIVTVKAAYAPVYDDFNKLESVHFIAIPTDIGKPKRV
jgi:methyl-accepting chemotaxis protein/PAS domain-containing protein